MTLEKVRWPFLAALAVILALAFWVRVSCFPAVLATGELVPRLDGDSHYHFDRILDAVARFPRVRHFDPLMNWPAGAFVPWADGFDMGGAIFGMLLGAGDPLRLPVAVALWPVVLGLAMVCTTVALVQAVLPGRPWRAAALAGGVSAALMPVGVHNSSFGRVDHHVFEALLLAALAAWSLRRLPPRRGQPAPQPSPLLFESAGALISGLGVYGFTGAPIYVAIAAAPLAWMAFADRRLVGGGGPGLVAGGLLAAALSLPAIADHHLLMSFKFPSLLQPGLLVLAGGGVMAAALVGAGRQGHRRSRWLVLGASLTLALAGMAALGQGAVSEVRGALSGWLLQQDPWISSIREFKPLLTGSVDGVPAWTRVHQDAGYAGFLLPVAAGIAAVLLPRRPRVAGLLWFAGALVGLALLQNRFDRPLVPLAAAVTGVALAAALRLVGRRWRQPSSLLLAPAVLALVTMLDPPTSRLLVEAPDLRFEPTQEMATDLRGYPLPAGPASGVLSNWSYGHQLQVQARVPVAVNGFGSYLDEAAFWRGVDVFRRGPRELDQYMVGARLGGLVAGTATIGQEVVGARASLSFDQGLLNREYMSSVPLSPLLIAGSAVPGWGVRHLPHLMPRHASIAAVAGLAFPLPYLWSFERVAGATVRGTAPAGVRVIAELKFTEHHRPHTYKAWTEAAPDGSWELLLPFPSGLVRPAIRSAASWTVAADGGVPRAFAIDEGAVRGGAAVDLGRLRGTP